MKAIPAIYKDRVFKPLEDVELDDYTKVLIHIERDPVADMQGLITVEAQDAEELLEAGYEDLE